MNFSEIKINDNIKKSLVELNFITTTEIQTEAIPFLLENKTDLINLAVDYYKTYEFRRNLHPNAHFLITNRESTWDITKDNVNQIFDCNQEADTRIVLHACLQDTPLVIVSKNTDVFVLLVYAYQQKKPSNTWLMKIGNDRYVNIQAVVNYLGEKQSMMLPHLHALTGCDSTSIFMELVKLKCYENA